MAFVTVAARGPLELGAGARPDAPADVGQALFDQVLQALRNDHVRGQELVADESAHGRAVLPRVYEDPWKPN